MQVFLTGLPPVDEHRLHKELTPHMEALGIVGYHCQKPRRKPIGFITFLEVSDATKFLERYGKLDKKPDQTVGSRRSGDHNQSYHQTQPPRLIIADTAVVAKTSRNGADKKCLEHIKHEQKRRAQRAQEVHERKNSSPSFQVSSIACGKNVFVGDEKHLSFATQTSINCSCIVKFTRRSVTVSLASSFRFDIPFDIIQDFIVSREHQQITFVLTETPRFYEVSALYRIAIGPLLKNTPKWVRATYCPSWMGHISYVEHCLVYQFQVLDSDFDHLVYLWKDHDYLSVTRYDLLAATSPNIIHDYVKTMRALERKLNANNGALPFSLLFQIQGLVSNNYIHPITAYSMLLEMESVAKDCRAKGTELPFTVGSMKRLRPKIPYPCVGVEPDDLDAIELLKTAVDQEILHRRGGFLQSKSYRAELPSHQAWVMKAMITPTRILLDGPDAESKNRMLRKFPNHTDYFLRCIFCDEDGQNLTYNPNVSNARIYERYREVMKDGILIAGRRYMFFNFSHSSLRAHSAWFVAPFTDDKGQQQDCDIIIKGLGDFDSIRVPAKCAARIGQALSEIPFSVPVSKLDIKSRYIRDVISRDGSRVFSDGVGTISTEAMELFWDYLPPLMKSAAPTCFQIRWAGAKGMLALDSRLEGKIFCIRKESMRKFKSNDLGDVGICNTSSRPLRLWLNRQMIKIMEDMGTNDEWFLKLQLQELKNLRAVTASISNTTAFLRKQAIGTPMDFPNFPRLLEKFNINYRDDIFMRTVVENAVLRELRSLKYKARIPVDGGVTLFGIMDETGFLKEGEIYVTFDKSNSRISRPPREGMVLVTRSPALHPGDIQIVRLVSPPTDSPLRDLKNCVVFSQHGARDLPSKLSGGDLDGDIYSIIWDPEAMPTKSFPPADYVKIAPPFLDHTVTREDIADFFINFMKTDVLGLVAIRHQIIADYEKQGTQSPDCIKLAALHSTAVDSSKSGVAVDLKGLPKAPRYRPDFLSPVTPLKMYDIGQVAHMKENENDEEQDDMGEAKHLYYESEKILGQLYRAIDEKKIWDKDVRRHDRAGSVDIWETLLRVPQNYAKRHKLNYEPLIPKAWEIRDMYETSVKDLMGQFSDNPRSPITEVEVFCGFIMNKRGRQTRLQRDYSSKLREEIERTMSWIVKQMQDPESGEWEDIASKRKGVIELCWACLVVGCASDTEGVNGEHIIGDLKSFKVLAACCLFKQLDQFLSMNSKGGKGAAAGGYVGVRGGRGGKQMALPRR